MSVVFQPCEPSFNRTRNSLSIETAFEAATGGCCWWIIAWAWWFTTCKAMALSPWVAKKCSSCLPKSRESLEAHGFFSSTYQTSWKYFLRKLAMISMIFHLVSEVSISVKAWKRWWGMKAACTCFPGASSKDIMNWNYMIKRRWSILQLSLRILFDHLGIYPIV